MAYLKNSTFEQGINGWFANNEAAFVTVGVIQDPSAVSGNAYLRVSTTVAGGSVASDFIVSGWPSVGAIAWLRAMPGAGKVTGVMALWQLDLTPTGSPVSHWTNFSVDEVWRPISTALDIDISVQGGDGSNFPNMRVEFYINTISGNNILGLDIDNVIVV